MHVQEVEIGKIKPYEKNPRKNDGAVEAVANSIKEFGWQQPIVCDKDMVIIAGHTRYKAAQKLGLDTVPVVVADGLTAKQVKAYRLADNKTGELADWDDGLLVDELKELLDIDMILFGFDEIEDKLNTCEDDYDGALPEEPQSRLGDIYQLGRHMVMCGDSTSAEDVALLMDGEKAHIVFTDPPWNVDYGRDEKHPSWKPRTILNDHMSTEMFGEFLTKSLTCIKSSVVPGAMVYMVMSAQEWGNLMNAMADCGFHWSSTIIWAKDSLVLSRKDYHTRYEPIWYGWADDSKRLCPLKDRTQDDVWEIPRPRRSEEHPTMKPVELVVRAIENSSREGDNVIDFFGGSGTTLIAAEKTKRRCFMMELDPKYVDVIINRWESLTGEKAKRVSGGE